MNNEILKSIDALGLTREETEVAVVESMMDFVDKQSIVSEESFSFYQEAKSESKFGDTVTQIWNAIKRFIKKIIEGFKKMIASFTNNRGNVKSGKPTKSVSAIAAEVLKHGSNKPDNINGWKIPKPNSKYITESYVEDEMYVMEADTEDSNEAPQRVQIVVDPKSEIKGGTVELKRNSLDVSYSEDGKTLKISYFGFGKGSFTKVKGNGDDVDIPGQDKEWYSSPKVALHIMTHEETRNKITDVVNLALRVMKHRKPADIQALKKADKVSNIVKIFLKPESHFYEIPVSQLTNVQAWASKLLTDMEAFTSTDVNINKLDSDTIKSLNMVVRLLMRIQISLNYISSAFNNMEIIDASFYRKIKSIALLDEFVGQCIKNGIPPKYVAYNAWLISNECICGNGQYKPIFGHARATIFPPNDKIVLKIALSGLGTVSNETESRFTKIFVDMDRIDLIAPVIKDFKNNAIVAMERVNGNFELPSSVLKDFTKKANDALDEYQKKKGKNLNIKVGSQHIGNVAYDNKYKCYRSIDYGVHYRETGSDKNEK